MGYGKVPKITLNNNTITLYVEVGDFEPGSLIEISGSATQENGAAATFYSVQEMPAGNGSDDDATLRVDSAVQPNAFVAGFPVTVVARAAEVWITTLEAATDATDPRTSGPVSDPPAAAWTRITSGPALVLPAPMAPAAPSLAAPQSPPSETSPPTTLTRHGTWWDRRKADRLDVVMGGRFTRLFPYLPAARFDHQDLERLAGAMIAPPEEPETDGQDDPEENQGIPAAYTYLGQFTDHDLTFDPVSQLRETLTGAQLRALTDFRTPRFDLDNLYGRGPDDQPYMYGKDGILMLPGEPMSGGISDPGAVQLPRGPNGRALIGDPRNDENRIVAQLHAIFLRFHNRVVQQLGGTGQVSFPEARQQVRWHYQWVLVTDFLRRVVGDQTYRSVFPDRYGPVPAIPRLREHDLELMPVEFSVAAYRFGHSMIRPRYRLNPAIERPIFSDTPGERADLGGFRPIPADWAIDWRYFIDLGGTAAPEPQLSYKIDTSLVNPLGHLPAQIASDPSCLALRNLERGVTFQLPSGQQVARALGVEPLADSELVIGKAIVQSPEPPLITEVAAGLAGNAPLWTYVLSEAQVMSWKNAPAGLANDETPVKLGPVGGRLVAEVFASLLRGDRTSYLYAEPPFTPIPDFTRDGEFGLAELINVALGHAPSA
jgi:hypothetical protein